MFWKWVTPKMLGMVTQTSVYHWLIDGKNSINFLNFCVSLFFFYFFMPFFISSIYKINFDSNLVPVSNEPLFLGESEPTKVFERTANLANNQIINYRCDPSEKWLVLIGIAPGSSEVSIAQFIIVSVISRWIPKGQV